MGTFPIRSVPPGAGLEGMPWRAQERAALRCAAARIIPADVRRSVPGADDAAIFEDMLATVGQDRQAVGAALRRLDAMSAAPFAVQDGAAQDAALAALQRDEPQAFMALAGLVVRCYYRDTRVMLALGMEPRPPHPRGFEVDAGDWSLLDPVRSRAGRIYRDAT